MRTIALCLSLLACTLLQAKAAWTPAQVDSLTYGLYLAEDWGQLIQTGHEALKQGIDFKFLEQRIGFAYYQKRDFYASMRHYEQALVFDKHDQGTLTYLYYSGLETGNTAYARYYAGLLSTESKWNLKLKAFQPVNGLDAEYNYQTNTEAYRSNTNYQRLGIGTDLGYSWSLYQTVDRFQQSATSGDAYNEYRSLILQDAYYGLLSKQFNPHFGLDLGYHYLRTKFSTDIYDLSLREVTETVDTLAYHGQLYFAGLRYKWNRWHLGLTSSYLTLEYNHVLQTGLQVGFAFPGSHNLFLNNSLWLLHDDNDQWLVSKHSLGILLGKKYWLEGYKTFGSLKNFADLNGLYVYNSFDPTLSRQGLSLFWYATPHWTFFGNYSFEIKQNTYLLQQYNQQSFTGGLLWKL